MENNFEQILIEFNNRARNVFFALYNEFRHSIAAIDRQRDENVLQQLLSKFTFTLKLQLEDIAKELLSRHNKFEFTEKLRESFPLLISNYVTEFTQKARSL